MESFSYFRTSTGDLHLSAQDHGFTVGDGVFETLLTSPAGILALDAHMDRLEKSAELVDLPIPMRNEILRGVDQLREHTGFKTSEIGRLRITWTGGYSELGSARSGNWSLAMQWAATKPWQKYSKLQSSNVVKFSKAATVGAKTTSYMENVIALNHALKAGFDEAALFNEFELLVEGTGSNIFLIQRDGQVLTPTLASGALAGITRALLLDVAPEIIETDVTRNHWTSSAAIFLTSTTRDLQQVQQLDSRQLSIEHPIYLDLAARFQHRKKREWQ